MRAQLPGYFQPQYQTPGSGGSASRAPAVSALCRRYYPYPITEGDLCLMQDKAEWDRVVTDGLDLLCCPRGRRAYYTRPWIQQPELGRSFNEIGSLSASAITFDGTDFPVLTFKVPEGYDGVINYYVNGIGSANATGFLEGSGSITWRLSANGRFLRDMGAVLFSQGSLLTPSPIPNGGIRVYAGNIITFSAAIASLAPINPAAVVLCACRGWFYPK